MNGNPPAEYGKNPSTNQTLSDKLLIGLGKYVPKIRCILGPCIQKDKIQVTPSRTTNPGAGNEMFTTPTQDVINYKSSLHNDEIVNKAVQNMENSNTGSSDSKIKIT